MQRIRHELRLAETISPFGVGSIVDVLGESLIAPDTSWWNRKTAPEIHCDRLVAQLGGGVLRQAPSHAGKSGEKTAALSYRRFPAWRFCERCGKLSQLTGKSKGKFVNKCDCGGGLVPMRFVAVCKEGSHIQDIPWFKWAHRGQDERMNDEVRFCRSYKELRFERSSERGEGLASLSVVCGGCKRYRPLSDLVGGGSLKRDGIRCYGQQPWELENLHGSPCEYELVATQRGATGNYIAERVSALDIPEGTPASVELQERIRAHDLYQRLLDDNGGPRSEQIAGWIAEELEVDVDLILKAAESPLDSSEQPQLQLKDGEWAAFVKKVRSGKDHGTTEFVVDGWQRDDFGAGDTALTKVIAGIGQVRRVREVRALRGFRRYSPNAKFLRADFNLDPKHRPNYPALELFGEGIFIQFDEEFISNWEVQRSVQARASVLQERRNALEWLIDWTYLNQGSWHCIPFPIYYCAV